MQLLIQLLFLVVPIFLNKFNPTNAIIEDALDILHVTKEVASGLLKTWDMIEQNSNINDVQLPIKWEKNRKLLKRLKEISRQMDDIEEQNAENTYRVTQSIKEFIEGNANLQEDLNVMRRIYIDIEASKQEMDKYTEDLNSFRPQFLLSFANRTVYPSGDPINNKLTKLFIRTTGSTGRQIKELGIFQNIANKLEDAKEQVCATRQSAQQFIFSLYSDVALTELKGYTMIQFSWMILRVYGNQNFTQEALNIRDDFEKRAKITKNIVQQVLKRAERIVWRCDPSKHIKGQTYDEITRLLQGFVINEVDMSHDKSCRQNCGYYTIAETVGCFDNLYCAQQPTCSGKILNCKYIDSDMWICPADLESNRRYEQIEYESGRRLGPKGSCSRGFTKVDSWWRWLLWHCSYCFCLCDETSLKSDRYFNLREVVSNTSNNMVVTGLKFIKVNRVIHLQIQEGKLQTRGNINASTLQWKPVDNYNIADENIKSGIDYHTMGWDKRAIDLDDLISDDPSYIVTGVRFRVVGTHLNLEIRLSEYNFESGTLINPDISSFWKSNDYTDISDEKRSQIILNNPDIPINSVGKSYITSNHNQYIEFVNTDFDKDAAQTTVPFIDIQEVTSNPAIPLSGLGIYYKGRKGYGGFIAPKLITFDFSPYIQSTPLE